MLVPVLIELVVDVAAPAQRGQIVGFVKGFHFGAPVFGVVILEPVIRNAGSAGAMLALGAATLVATLITLISGNLRARPVAAETTG